MKKRQFPRVKRRVNCDLDVEGADHVGVVRDLSPRGFFVQTRAAPAIGSKILVKLRSATSIIKVEATVANRRVTPPRLATVVRGGLGCAVACAPEEYYQFLASIS